MRGTFRRDLTLAPGPEFRLTRRLSARLRVPAAEIEGVHVAFSGGRARAWVETRDGDQVALVEGEEREVRRIADQLSGVVRLASSSPPPMVH